MRARGQAHHHRNALLVRNDVDLRVVDDLAAKMLQKNRERALLVMQLDIFDGAVFVKLDPADGLGETIRQLIDVKPGAVLSLEVLDVGRRDPVESHRDLRNADIAVSSASIINSSMRALISGSLRRCPALYIDGSYPARAYASPAIDEGGSNINACSTYARQKPLVPRIRQYGHDRHPNSGCNACQAAPLRTGTQRDAACPCDAPARALFKFISW